MWKRVDWIDEMIIQAGGFGDVYVTCTAEEKYESLCLVPKFRNRSSVMVHGSISRVSKGPPVVFEQEWGKATLKVYSENVLPHIYLLNIFAR
ncbi:hypothetical protein K469DRAFT_798615 [Zopfia rhizophila CBS 207.26]|uniref:Uncharacterized protein n=1 Tax=Zopfia rhizophila CBS 207.26 TaxID=1314779 RepID=A0A6A6DMH0_9PEZI|nr:hypothetical protein K469DRAFT_798615 [Zopfia rhizophila CBS 207.26]